MLAPALNLYELFEWHPILAASRGALVLDNRPLVICGAEESGVQKSDANGAGGAGLKDCFGELLARQARISVSLDRWFPSAPQKRTVQRTKSSLWRRQLKRSNTSSGAISR